MKKIWWCPYFKQISYNCGYILNGYPHRHVDMETHENETKKKP